MSTHTHNTPQYIYIYTLYWLSVAWSTAPWKLIVKFRASALRLISPSSGPEP